MRQTRMAGLHELEVSHATTHGSVGLVQVNIQGGPYSPQPARPKRRSGTPA